MRSFFAAVAQFLRSLPRFVYERVQIAGEWISRLVAVPAEPEPLQMAGNEPALGAEDPDSVATRAIAAQLVAGNIPAPELSGQVSEERFEWLCSLTPDMLKAVVEADAKALRDHLRQKQSIRGVLAADVETVRAYNRRRDTELEEALEPDQDLAWKVA